MMMLVLLLLLLLLILPGLCRAQHHGPSGEERRVPYVSPPGDQV